MLQTTTRPLTSGILAGMVVASLLIGGIFLFREAVIPHKTPTEIGKLFQVLSLYRTKDCQVIYNGNLYEITKMVDRARHFVASQYRGEGAQAWVWRYLYRTPDEGKIMYLVFPDGQRRLLRDVFLEELNRLFPV